MNWSASPKRVSPNSKRPLGPGLRPEAGNSKANAYHWIASLGALGHVDRTVTADVPLFAVFRKGAE